MHFSQKHVHLAYLNSKTVFLTTFARILFINFRVVAATQLIIVNLRDTFLYERRSICELLHWHRNGLKIHNATYDDFSILIPENNQFKLHLKESLLIKRDRPELNKNIYIHPWRFLHNDISYCNVCYCIIRIIVLLTIPCFYKKLDNSSSL